MAKVFKCKAGEKITCVHFLLTVPRDDFFVFTEQVLKGIQSGVTVSRIISKDAGECLIKDLFYDRADERGEG